MKAKSYFKTENDVIDWIIAHISEEVGSINQILSNEGFTLDEIKLYWENKQKEEKRYREMELYWNSYGLKNDIQNDATIASAY